MNNPERGRTSRLVPVFDRVIGPAIPLPPALARFYGTLRMPRPATIPHVYANFASTLDGVVAFDPLASSGGGEITGSDPEDRRLLGLLRAIADVIVVGAGTVRASPRHRWTLDRVDPPSASEYSEVRRRLRMPPVPLRVVVTARGEVDPAWAILAPESGPTAIVTTSRGARRLARVGLPDTVDVVSARAPGGRIGAAGILDAIQTITRPRRILLEGGPQLLGTFLSDERLAELFLTLAPQIAGRTDGARPVSLVEGDSFGPRSPRWGRLSGLREGRHSLFLRYDWASASSGRPPARGRRHRDRGLRGSGRTRGHGDRR